MSTSTTEKDVVLDLLAAIEAYEGLCGSGETTISSVVEGERETLLLTLSNGDAYEVRVRQQFAQCDPSL